MAESDTPRDLLREVFASYKGKLPSSIEEFRVIGFDLIEKAIALIADEFESPRATKALGAGTAVVQLLQLMSRDRDPRTRMDAYCYQRLLGLEGRSFQTLGDELGVRKATVHKRYREIQQRTGLKGRGDKSDEARETYRKLRTGQRRPRLPWAGLNVWQKLSIQPLAA